MPPSSPLNPYTHSSSLQLSSPISSSSFLPPATPRQHQDELVSRRRSFFKQPPSRSIPSSPSPGSPSGSRQQPSNVSDELWRDRFKKKCDDRVRRDKERTQRRRSARAAEPTDGRPPSSDPVGDGVAQMDMQDAEEDEDEDEDEKEIFRRIIRAQQRRAAERSWGAPPDSTHDLDRLLEHEQEVGPAPGEDGMGEEPPDDDQIDPEYLDYLLSQQNQMDDIDKTPSQSPPLSPPPCPACDTHPSLTVTSEGALTCASCSSTLSPATSYHIESAWTADRAHSGPEPLMSHQLGLLMTSSEYGEVSLEARCSGMGCGWAMEIDV